METLDLGNQHCIAYEQHGIGPDIVWVSGGGDSHSSWLQDQVPAFPEYRSTVFDNRGVGATICEAPLPWTIADMAKDTAELIRTVCEPPVVVIGLSMGALITQQVAIDFPELVRCAIPMGTAPKADGWILDYMTAEIEFRKAGGELTGMMAVSHYLAALYPSAVLGDPELYPQLRGSMLEWLETGDNEHSLIGQWDACCTFDQTEGLPRCSVPMHVFGFAEDVQAPASGCKRVADLAQNGTYHHFEGLGHCSLYGHAPDRVNAEIKAVLAGL